MLRIRPMSQTVNIALHQELVIPLSFVTFRPTATNTPFFRRLSRPPCAYSGPIALFWSHCYGPSLRQSLARCQHGLGPKPHYRCHHLVRAAPPRTARGTHRQNGDRAQRHPDGAAATPVGRVWQLGHQTQFVCLSTTHTRTVVKELLTLTNKALEALFLAAHPGRYLFTPTTCGHCARRASRGWPRWGRRWSSSFGYCGRRARGAASWP